MKDIAEAIILLAVALALAMIVFFVTDCAKNESRGRHEVEKARVEKGLDK